MLFSHIKMIMTGCSGRRYRLILAAVESEVVKIAKKINSDYAVFSQSKYINSWQKGKIKAYTFKYFYGRDDDIIDQLEKQKSKRGYIAGLIRDDIKKGN